MQGSVPGLDAEAAEELFTKECRNWKSENTVTKRALV
jgi:hypothetical protein